MCGCSSASHVSCIPHNQGLAAGWGPLSHSNGCNLIHNQGFTHIIAITVSCQPPLRCLQDPSQVSVLGTHSVHCCRGRGNIRNHAFVPSWHLNDWWSWSLECRALHCHWGGNYQGVKTGYFGHILSSSTTALLHCRCWRSKLPNLPIFVGKRCERKYAGCWLGRGGLPQPPVNL